jgi:hypothetical protein
MTMRNDARELADQIVSSAFRELRLAVQNYRDRACWRLTFHTSMIRRLRQREQTLLTRARLGWHINHQLTAAAQCEANQTEKMLAVLCLSALSGTADA